MYYQVVSDLGLLYNDLIRQGKHPSELTHPDPQELINRKSGTGQKQYTKKGELKNTEVVDFGEPIGSWVSEDGKTKLTTNRGTIHYGKNGAHIVPAHPTGRP